MLYYTRSAREDNVDTALWSSNFDPETGRLTGSPRRFFQFSGDLRFSTPDSNSPVALDDRIIFVANEERSDAWLLEPAPVRK